MRSTLLHWSRRHIARLAQALPSSCALCGQAAATSACTDCRTQFFGRPQVRCAQCATVLPRGAGLEKCAACLKRPPAFDRTIAAADYAAPVDQLVLSLKFGSRLAVAPLCAQLLGEALQRAPCLAMPDVLTAVPLGSHRLIERGFNQSLEIARPLAKSLRISLEPRLAMRQRDTRAQTLLPPDERRRNMRNAFTINGDAIDRIRGRHVGVVDDVMTTGETLDELAATLKRFGAARVTNFVFARTLPQ